MATCGYLCPACEGRGYDEKGESCNWCSPEEKGNKTANDALKEKKEEEVKAWIEQVHGRCCGDL